MNQQGQHQQGQGGGGGRNRGRNRGGGQGQGGNILNVPGIPPQVQQAGWDALPPAEVGALIRMHMEASSRRLDQETADTAAEKALTRREKEQTLAKDQAETESASKKSKQAAAALVARGLAAYLASINGITALAELLRNRITVQFLDKLTPQALEHFRATLGSMSEPNASDAAVGVISSIFGQLAQIESDAERFHTAYALGLLPEQHLRS